MPPRSSNKKIIKHERSASQLSTKQSTHSNGDVNSVKLWLKEQLEEAWKREFELKKLVKTVTETKSDTMEIQIAALERQTGRVREEVERWQMRNEEVEQHL